MPEEIQAPMMAIPVPQHDVPITISAFWMSARVTSTWPAPDLNAKVTK